MKNDGATMVKRIAVLAENDYEDLELWYPFLRLREAGHEPIVVGTGSNDVYFSKHGYEVKVNLPISAARPKDFHGVIIPGGWAPDKLRRHPPIKGFVKDMFENGKLVASICHGGSVLISAGILKGMKVTSVSAIKDDLLNAGARYKDEEVVVHRNLITSRRPADLPAFMREVLKMLGK
jgi:protease I